MEEENATIAADPGSAALLAPANLEPTVNVYSPPAALNTTAAASTTHTTATAAAKTPELVVPNEENQDRKDRNGKQQQQQQQQQGQETSPFFATVLLPRHGRQRRPRKRLLEELEEERQDAKKQEKEKNENAPDVDKDDDNDRKPTASSAAFYNMITELDNDNDDDGDNNSSNDAFSTGQEHEQFDSNEKDKKRDKDECVKNDSSADEKKENEDCGGDDDDDTPMANANDETTEEANIVVLKKRKEPKATTADGGSTAAASSGTVTTTTTTTPSAAATTTAKRNRTELELLAGVWYLQDGPRKRKKPKCYDDYQMMPVPPPGKVNENGNNGGQVLKSSDSTDQHNGCGGAADAIDHSEGTKDHESSLNMKTSDVREAVDGDQVTHQKGRDEAAAKTKNSDIVVKEDDDVAKEDTSKEKDDAKEEKEDSAGGVEESTLKSRRAPVDLRRRIMSFQGIAPSVDEDDVSEASNSSVEEDEVAKNNNTGHSRNSWKSANGQTSSADRLVQTKFGGNVDAFLADVFANVQRGVKCDEYAEAQLGDRKNRTMRRIYQEMKGATSGSTLGAHWKERIKEYRLRGNRAANAAEANARKSDRSVESAHNADSEINSSSDQEENGTSLSTEAFGNDWDALFADVDAKVNKAKIPVGQYAEGLGRYGARSTITKIARSLKGEALDEIWGSFSRSIWRDRVEAYMKKPGAKKGKPPAVVSTQAEMSANFSLAALGSVGMLISEHFSGDTRAFLAHMEMHVNENGMSPLTYAESFNCATGHSTLRRISVEMKGIPSDLGSIWREMIKDYRTSGKQYSGKQRTIKKEASRAKKTLPAAKTASHGVRDDSIRYVGRNKLGGTGALEALIELEFYGDVFAFLENLENEILQNPQFKINTYLQKYNAVTAACTLGPIVSFLKRDGSRNMGKYWSEVLTAYRDYQAENVIQRASPSRRSKEDGKPSVINVLRRQSANEDVQDDDDSSVLHDAPKTVATLDKMIHKHFNGDYFAFLEVVEREMTKPDFHKGHAFLAKYDAMKGSWVLKQIVAVLQGSEDHRLSTQWIDIIESYKKRKSSGPPVHLPRPPPPRPPSPPPVVFQHVLLHDHAQAPPGPAEVLLDGGRQVSNAGSSQEQNHVQEPPPDFLHKSPVSDIGLSRGRAPAVDSYPAQIHVPGPPSPREDHQPREPRPDKFPEALSLKMSILIGALVFFAMTGPFTLILFVLVRPYHQQPPMMPGMYYMPPPPNARATAMYHGQYMPAQHYNPNQQYPPNHHHHPHQQHQQQQYYNPHPHLGYSSGGDTQTKDDDDSAAGYYYHQHYAAPGGTNTGAQERQYHYPSVGMGGDEEL